MDSTDLRAGNLINVKNFIVFRRVYVFKREGKKTWKKSELISIFLYTSHAVK
jgi:hypothetical protein